ncbi:MAG: sialidase family protein [Pirellulales bacterium]
MKTASLLLAAALAACSLGLPGAARAVELGPGLEKLGFLYDRASFPSCHASTLVETADGAILAAFFGGSDEGEKDVGIWLCRLEGDKWSAPQQVATGHQPDGSQLPCWNPVLFQPKEGPLLLFYKVGPKPSAWWGMLKTSEDGGRTWSEGRRLPDGILGPIKNKPIQLADGTLLCGSSSEHDGWKLHFERTPDLGKTWERTPPLPGYPRIEAIQPGFLTYADGQIQALCRSQQGRVVETSSNDGGRTWSDVTATVLPNPDAGTDSVTLPDGRGLLLYNHTTSARSPLNLAVTRDGRTWEAALVLEDEPGEYSYPAIIVARDGKVHLTYTWKRRKIRYGVIDPAKLVLRPMPEGKWPQ